MLQSKDFFLNTTGLITLELIKVILVPSKYKLLQKKKNCGDSHVKKINGNDITIKYMIFIIMSKILNVPFSKE